MIINRRNKQVLARKVVYANHLWTRMLGLMGKRELLEGHALYIYPCRKIHTYFMRFPIDCLFINQDYQVIELLAHFEPWKVSPSVNEAYGVIELPSGVIENTNTQRYDVLEIFCKGKLMNEN